MNEKHETLTLIHPVEYGDSLVTELRLRRPQGKHLRRLDLAALETASLDLMMNLVADLSGQPPELIDRLEGPDVFAAIAVVTDFLGAINPPSMRP